MGVSVIIPVFNGSLFLKSAIQSILDQNYDPIEVIVVDDGSTDNSAEIAQSFSSKVNLIRQKNKGPSSARNKGIRLARHELIAFLDADDLWTDSSLAARVNFLKKYSHLSAVLGHSQRTNRSCSPELFASLGGALFHRSAFNTIGLLDEALEYGEDVDVFFRLREQGLGLGIISDTVQIYRIHKDNRTRMKNTLEMGVLKVLHQSIRRRDGKQLSQLYSDSSHTSL